MKLNYQSLNRLDQDRTLSDGCVRLLHDLARVQRGSLTWFKMSHAKMAAIIGRSVATVKRYINELVNAGYLVKRLNAAITCGIKHRIASSYRFIQQGGPEPARKARSLMQIAAIYRKAAGQTALWLMRDRIESDKNLFPPQVAAFSGQTALEAMQADRKRRL